MNSEKQALLPRNLSVEKIKNFLFPDFENIDPKIKNYMYQQSTPSLFLLMATVFFVSILIVILSFFSNLTVFSLVKSLLIFVVFFAIIGALHKILDTRKSDFYLLLISLIFIATWGVMKDIINFFIMFSNYGILYVTILFFALIFMPVKPYWGLILGFYCAILYLTLWLFFVYTDIGYDYAKELEEWIGMDFFRPHYKVIAKNFTDYHFPHFRFFTAWYLLQYVLFGVLAFLFRAANLQIFIKSFEAEENLQTMQDLLAKTESQVVEYKSTARWDLRRKQVNKELEQVIVKTIAGFMNAEGGTLFIGVDDNGRPLGLENDLKTIRGKDLDNYELYLVRLISDYMGKDYCSNVKILFLKAENKDICVLKVKPNDKPVFVERLDQAFFVRTGNNTQMLNTKEAIEYIKRRFQ